MTVGQLLERHIEAPRLTPREHPRLAAAGIAVAAALVGVMLADVGGRFGVAAMVGIPIGLVCLALVFDRPWIGAAAIFVSLPWSLKQLPGGFVLIQCVAMLLIIAGVIRRLAAGRLPFARIPQLGWGVAILSLALLATPGSLDATAAAKQDVDVVLGLFLTATIATHVSLRILRRLVHVLLVVGSGICLVSLSQASSLHAGNGTQSGITVLHGVFTEHNQFGQFCAVILVVALGNAIGARSPRERVLASAAALSALAPLVLALSRGAWLGCIVALALLSLLLPTARRVLLAVGVPILIAAPLLGVFAPDLPEVQVVQQRVQSLRHPVADPYDSRPLIWREAGREIEDSPWLGQGPGQFPYVAAQSTSLASTVAPAHAHNVLLTVAAEVGIPAALMLAAFTLEMLAVLRRVVRRLRATPDAALVAGIGASLGVLVGQGLVDFTLRNADLFLLTASLTGLVLAANVRTSPDTTR